MSQGSKFIAQRKSPTLPLEGGQWYSGFSTVKKYAIANYLPFFAMWTRTTNCSHCTKLEGCFNDSTWKSYMRSTDFIYWVGCDLDPIKGEDGEYGKGVQVWASNNSYNTSLPCVRFYWKAKAGTELTDGTVLSADKVIVDVTTYGDKVDGYKGKNEGGPKNCISYFKKIFKQYKPQVEPTYYSVTFQDYDYIQISTVQTVLSGDSAIPPDNPSRGGYAFISWSKSYENVTCDISCVAQYEKIQTVYDGSYRSIPVGEICPDSTKYRYSDSDMHNIRFSPNVIGINAQGK